MKSLDALKAELREAGGRLIARPIDAFIMRHWIEVPMWDKRNCVTCTITRDIAEDQDYVDVMLSYRIDEALGVSRGRVKAWSKHSPPAYHSAKRLHEVRERLSYERGGTPWRLFESFLRRHLRERSAQA